MKKISSIFSKYYILSRKNKMEIEKNTFAKVIRLISKFLADYSIILRD